MIQQIKNALVFSSLCCLSMNTFAVKFNSGSTGADGAYAPNCGVPDTIITMDMSAGPVKNFTDITIGANCIIRFTPTGNSDTTFSQPVVWLASGDVVIDGLIDVGSQGYVGGPGGYDVGGVRAFGPADTTAVINTSYIGNGGQPGQTGLSGSSGSNIRGGGGAILLAVSGKLTLIGSINSGSDAYGTAGWNGKIFLYSTAFEGVPNLIGFNSGFIKTIYNLSGSTSSILQELTKLSLTVNTFTEPGIEILSVNDVDIINNPTLPGEGDYDVKVQTTNLLPGSRVVIKTEGTQTPLSLTHAFVDANGSGEATGTLHFLPGESTISVSVQEMSLQ